MLSDAQAAYRTMMQLSLDDKEESRTHLASVTARAKNDHPIDWIALLGVETSRGQLTSRRRIGSWRSCIIPIRRVRAA